MDWLQRVLDPQDVVSGLTAAVWMLKALQAGIEAVRTARSDRGPSEHCGANPPCRVCPARGSRAGRSRAARSQPVRRPRIR